VANCGADFTTRRGDASDEFLRAEKKFARGGHFPRPASLPQLKEETTMRQTADTKNRAETGTLLAATFACYLLGLACVFALSYSLAALAAPGLARNARAALQAEARP
jgi:hypothetical protein